tara:strand:- start:83 stop:193 length:111 start_codon:yes stop_codon:yes gene_type:complete
MLQDLEVEEQQRLELQVQDHHVVDQKLEEQELLTQF